MSLQTATLYNKPDFSDVTIKFSGREIYCHKLILCTESAYFAKLCGPGGHFAEAGQRVIELKEDDPDAVEAVLKWIYTKNDNTGQDQNWRLQHEISQAASKYLLPILAGIASHKYKQHVNSVSDPQEVFETIQHVRANVTEKPILELADAIETKYLLQLMKVQDFRQLISQDQSRMWKYLDHFTDTLLRIKSFR